MKDLFYKSFCFLNLFRIGSKVCSFLSPPPGRKYAMLKLKILLSTLLRNYRIHATIPEKDFKLTADIILKRADGFKISLEPRKKSGLNITSPTGSATGVRA